MERKDRRVGAVMARSVMLRVWFWIAAVWDVSTIPREAWGRLVDRLTYAFDPEREAGGHVKAYAEDPVPNPHLRVRWTGELEALVESATALYEHQGPRSENLLERHRCASFARASCYHAEERPLEEYLTRPE